MDKSPKTKRLKVAIVVDPMGSGYGEVTPEDEIREHTDKFSNLLRPAKLDVYTPRSAYPGDIQEGTDLILFDFGGMSMGNDLMETNSRELVRWALDHPTSLAIVVSSFTYRNAVVGEMREMGMEEILNVVCDEHQDDPFPKWFRDLHGIPYTSEPPRTARRATAGLAALGGSLPSIKFFEPNGRFVDYMYASFRHYTIYDVGAGCGHVSRKLANAGLQVVAIDVCGRDNPEYDVEIEDGTICEYDKGSVVLIARPCHGPFCEDVIRQAVLCKALCVLYVGLPKNRLTDLGGFSRQFKRVLTLAGENNEVVYLMKVVN